MESGQNPQSNLIDINRVIGHIPGTIPRSSAVGGVNPTKLSCDDLVVRHGFALGQMITRLIAINGSRTNTAIGFIGGTAGTGVYSPATDRMNVAIAGVDVCYFSPLGTGFTNVYSPTGIMDFGGATLVNIGGITANPRSYEIVGAYTPTIGATSAIALTIPLVLNAGLSSTWEFETKVMYVLSGSGGTLNGVYTFRTRGYLTSGGSTTPTISSAYDITRYENPALTGTLMEMTATLGAATVSVTGLAAQTIVWQAKSNVVRVESA